MRSGSIRRRHSDPIPPPAEGVRLPGRFVKFPRERKLPRKFHRQQLASVGVNLLCLGVFFLLAFRLAPRIWYELQGPYTWDSPLYWGVGRGILNGLEPYRDLFESKPPGIFLISSLSLWLTDGMTLGAVLQTGALLVLVLSPAIPILIHRRQIRLLSGRIGFVTSLALGTSISLYTAERSGEFQVESFGAAFGALYAAQIVAFTTNHRRVLQLIWASLLLMGAIGMKEPFLLTGLATALTICESPRMWFKRFVMPVVLAGLVGCASLWLWGILDPYFTIYLREMLGQHIHSAGPLWIRGFSFWRLWNDLQEYSPALAWLIVAIAFRYVLQDREPRKILLNGVRLSASVYLLLLAVGMGGDYYNHHFVFAVPVYVALFAAVPYAGATASNRSRLLGTLLVLSLTVAALVWQKPIPYQERISHLRRHDRDARNTAAAIDLVLDNCNLDRYLFLGTNGPRPFGYTRHSPLGPLFFQYHRWLSGPRVHFQRTFLQNLRTAEIVVMANDIEYGDVRSDAETILAERFQRSPWDCAGFSPTGRDYRFLYADRETACWMSE